MNQHAPPAPSLYDDDFYAWSQSQARLVAALARLGGRLPEGLDIPNLVEEVESLGRSELSRASSYIRLILVHLIKAASDPDAQALRHWTLEVDAFHLDLLEHFSRSMRQNIDMELIWRRARGRAGKELAGRGITLAELPETCPFQVADFVVEDFDFDAALRRLAPGS